jgi:hypothetical protein
MTENKSFADVFDSMLSEPKKFLSFLLMLGCVAGLIFLSFVTMNKYSGASIQEINISATGSKVLFQTSTTAGEKESLVIVHPQGWQNTGIHVEEGSKLSFKSDGRVNIDGGGLFRTVIARRDLEDQIKKQFNLDNNSDKEDQAPESHFTPEQIEHTMLPRPWVDPGGFAANTRDEEALQLTYGNRKKRLELEGANLGSLIGRIGDGSKHSKTFGIGRKLLGYTAEATGDLWLNVNDVKNLQLDLRQEMFYQDNLGFFWVVVTSKSK